MDPTRWCASASLWAILSGCIPFGNYCPAPEDRYVPSGPVVAEASECEGVVVDGAPTCAFACLHTDTCLGSSEITCEPCEELDAFATMACDKCEVNTNNDYVFFVCAFK